MARSSTATARRTKEPAGPVGALRLDLLDRLDRPQSASGLAREMGLPRQKLAYHLRELERQGLVELVDQRVQGNCVERRLRATTRSYFVRPDVMRAIADSARAARSRVSAAYLLGTAARMVRDLVRLTRRAASAGKRLATVTVETNVRFSSARRRSEFLTELNTAVADLVTRYHDDKAGDGREFRFVIAGYPRLPEEDEDLDRDVGAGPRPRTRAREETAQEETDR